MSLFTRPNLTVVPKPLPRAPKLGLESGPVEIARDASGGYWMTMRSFSGGEVAVLVTADTLRTIIDVAEEELRKDER